MIYTEESAMYVCKVCGWKGLEVDLEVEKAENCAGKDEYEICPRCGSGDVVLDWSVQISKES
jgi:predicted RNA-binding Zn-ribbon protein involved in translation (DUF1610 family)